jgi:NAD(P)-dependent dehydrogenase (short-subunit alcohol dehydrogenase family)
MTREASSLIVMSGATSGFGLQAARALGQRDDVHLIVGARTPARATILRSAIPGERLTVLPLDTSSLSSVRAFAAAVEEERRGQPISALGLNAGTQSGAALQLTDDGLERTFATNYLGHFLLVEELKGALAPSAAIVITASQSHHPEDRIGKFLGYRGAVFPSAEAVARGELDMSVSPAQQARDRYATSKLCCLLWTFGMARRTRPEEMRFIAYDPGTVPATQIARELGLGARLGWSHLLPLAVPFLPGFSTPDASGRTLARLLTNPKLAPGTGLYLNFQTQPAALWEAAKRSDWQDDLLNLSWSLIEAGSRSSVTAEGLPDKTS